MNHDTTPQRGRGDDRVRPNPFAPPKKKFFANNLHHSTNLALFGCNTLNEKAAEHQQHVVVQMHRQPQEGSISTTAEQLITSKSRENNSNVERYWQEYRKNMDQKRKQQQDTVSTENMNAQEQQQQQVQAQAMMAQQQQEQISIQQQNNDLQQPDYLQQQIMQQEGQGQQQMQPQSQQQEQPQVVKLQDMDQWNQYLPQSQQDQIQPQTQIQQTQGNPVSSQTQQQNQILDQYQPVTLQQEEADYLAAQGRYAQNQNQDLNQQYQTQQPQSSQSNTNQQQYQANSQNLNADYYTQSSQQPPQMPPTLSPIKMNKRNVAQQINNQSTEQQRYFARLAQASRRQDEAYKNNYTRVRESEKDKYARMVENQQATNLKHISQQNQEITSSQSQKRIPLGKVVNQVEMTNEETRKQLKEMLEYQIMEKNDREKTSEFIPMAQRQKYMRERAMRNQIESSSMQEGGSNAAMANQKLAPPCKPPLAKPIERYNVVNGYQNNRSGTQVGMSRNGGGAQSMKELPRSRTNLLANNNSNATLLPQLPQKYTYQGGIDNQNYQQNQYNTVIEPSPSKNYQYSKPQTEQQQLRPLNHYPSVPSIDMVQQQQRMQQMTMIPNASPGHQQDNIKRSQYFATMAQQNMLNN